MKLIFAILLLSSFVFADMTTPPKSVEAQYLDGFTTRWIKNPGAELASPQFIAYQDAAQSSPVDATGGTPQANLCSRTTSSPLFGGGSFLLAKTGTANRQGQGCSILVDVERGDRAKPSMCKITYEVVSGTYSGGTAPADSDVTVYAVPVNGTDLTVKQLAPHSLRGTVAGQYYDSGAMEFQTTSDATQYHFALHIATTSTADYSLKYEIQCGRGVSSRGPPVGDSTTFTPTGSFTTNTTYTGKYTRIGDRALIDVEVNFSGAPNSTTLTVNMPPGLSVDTSKLTSAQTVGHYLGTGGLFDSSGGNSTPLWVEYSSATSVRLAFGDDTDGSPAFLQTAVFVTQADPFTIASGDRINIKWDVPILGWSTGQVPSSENSGRVLGFTASAPTNGSIADGASATVLWGTVAKDDVGAYSTSTGIYTVTEPGWYKIEAKIAQTGTTAAGAANSQMEMGIQKNGGANVGYGYGYAKVTNSLQHSSAADALEYLVAGDNLRVTFANGMGSAITLNSNPSQTKFSVIKWAGGQIAASESVYATYTSSSTTVNPVTINFNTRVEDSHGAVTTGDGSGVCRFTAPIAGRYKFYATTDWVATAANYNVNDYVGLKIMFNGVARFRNRLRVTVSGAPNYQADVEGSINMKAGEYVTIDNYSSTNPNINPSGVTTDNYFTVERVGN